MAARKTKMSGGGFTTGGAMEDETKDERAFRIRRQADDNLRQSYEQTWSRMGRQPPEPQYDAYPTSANRGRKVLETARPGIQARIDFRNAAEGRSIPTDRSRRDPPPPSDLGSRMAKGGTVKKSRILKPASKRK